MNAKNKDLPAYPIKFVDQFNQTVVLGGLTKQELVALELLKGQLANKDFAHNTGFTEKFYIAWAFEQAEIFCNYQEEKSKTTINQSKIIS